MHIAIQQCTDQNSTILSLARYDPLPRNKGGGAKRGRGSSQTRKMISFITRISGNVIHAIIASPEILPLSQIRHGGHCIVVYCCDLLSLSRKSGAIPALQAYCVLSNSRASSEQCCDNCDR